jgi:serine phosphatase RsbU (regulator of sigma subunit)
VSGDFYFFNTFSGTEDHPGRASKKEEAGLFIAAADCTGHGVPGALMSMIVHEKLENATKFHGEPGDILHSVNKQVKDSLKQHQTDASRDGCDIALCKIQGTTLTYAGAYRPLYLFYKNGEFKEIKATKTAIAGLTSYDQKFEQHQFDTKELKAIYMFSDGYADQFGGQKMKKLTTKKFKELLHSVVNSPIKDQNEQLESFFNKWKGNVEQIDDVLVIGIIFP